MARAISRLVWPSQTRPATCISLAVIRSRGCMFHLLLGKHRRRQLHPFSAVPDTRPQEKRPQVLLYRARADLQLRRDLFVAAALYQQLQDLFIARCNLDLVQAQHSDSSLILIAFTRRAYACAWVAIGITQKQLLRQSFAGLHKGTKPCECYILVYGPRCPGRAAKPDPEHLVPQRARARIEWPQGGQYARAGSRGRGPARRKYRPQFARERRLRGRCCRRRPGGTVPRAIE